MVELKTKVSKQSVTAFLNGIADEQKRKDARTVMKLMKAATGKQARMWGDSMVGFGSYHYKYASGREGNWFLTGFSPRKQALTLYIMAGFSGYDGLMKKLGKYKTGKSCLYVKKLEDVDLKVLQELIERSVQHMLRKYG